MTHGSGDRARYLVELAAPEAGWHDVERMLERARGAGAAPNGRARLIRSIFVPEDSRFYLLYEADSETAARAAATDAELVVTSVAETVHTEKEEMP